jgi:DNA-binding transcriptional regulator WhiA
MPRKAAPQPPFQEVDKTEEFITKFKNERLNLIRELYKVIGEYYSIDRDLFVYRLIKVKDMPVYTVADAAGLTPKAVYDILDKVESGVYT